MAAEPSGNARQHEKIEDFEEKRFSSVTPSPSCDWNHGSSDEASTGSSSEDVTADNKVKHSKSADVTGSRDDSTSAAKQQMNTSNEVNPPPSWHRLSEKQSVASLGRNEKHLVKTASSSSSQSKVSVKRKREGCVRSTNKVSKNSGLEYKTYAGKGDLKPAVDIGPDCQCPLKCFEKVNVQTRKCLFDAYWNLVGYDQQNGYLSSLMQIVGVKRRYSRSKPTSIRNKTVIYHVPLQEGETNVCKTAFCSIFGIKRGRVDVLIKKMGTQSPLGDQRGRHNNRPNSITEQQTEALNSFFRKSLVYTGKFYNPKDSLYKQYFGAEQTQDTLYDQYMAHIEAENLPKGVSRDKFKRVLRTFILTFTSSDTDSQEMCSSGLKISGFDNQNETSEEEQCEESSDMEENQKDKSMLPNTVGSFFSQDASVPKVPVELAFFLQKLWGYNIGTQSADTGSVCDKEQVNYTTSTHTSGQNVSK